MEQGSRTHSRSDVTLTEAGEAEIIRVIREAAPSTLNGDDAAVIPTTGGNSRMVCSTDMLVEDRHFRFDFSSPREVGAKAVAQNFADIQAMGARPTSMLFALAAPGDLPLHIVREIAQGIASAATPWGAELVGGDVVRSSSLVLNITAIGELTGPDAPLTVDAASVGHKIILQGNLGWSSAGLAILQACGSRADVPTDDDVINALVNWHCAPDFPVGRGFVARATGAAAMTDNSDGLLADASLIATRSQVNLDFDKEAITPSEELWHAQEFLRARGIEADPWEWVLNGGEDHCLIGTTGARVPSGYRQIGWVRGIHDHDDRLISIDGNPVSAIKGWESL